MANYLVNDFEKNVALLVNCFEFIAVIIDCFLARQAEMVLGEVGQAA